MIASDPEPPARPQGATVEAPDECAKEPSDALGIVVRIVDRAAEVAVVLLFFAMLATGFGQIFNRFVLNASLSWSEEFQRFAHIWLIFLAIPIGYRRGAHIGVDLLERALAARPARVLAFVIDVCWLTLGVSIIWTTWVLMQVAQRQTAPALHVSMDKVYFGLVLGASYLVFVASRRILNDLRGRRGRAG